MRKTRCRRDGRQSADALVRSCYNCVATQVWNTVKCSTGESRQRSLRVRDGRGCESRAEQSRPRSRTCLAAISTKLQHTTLTPASIAASTFPDVALCAYPIMTAPAGTARAPNSFREVHVPLHPKLEPLFHLSSLEWKLCFISSQL
jgi:hypothetical protein